MLRGSKERTSRKKYAPQLRLTAGEDVAVATQETHETARTNTSGKEKKTEPTLKLLASAYFLEWQQTAFQAYTRSVNKLFVQQLIKHVTKSNIKADERSLNSAKEREALAKGAEPESNSDQHQLRERLKEATANSWDNDGLHVHAGEQMSTLAEIAVMHRMKTLVQMSGSMLEVMERASKWMLKHLPELVPHAATLNILPYVTYSFEAISAISEVFGLTSVDRNKCKAEFTHLLRAVKGSESEPRVKDSKMFIDEKDVRGSVKKLEAQCNHLRTCVYVIGTCLAATLQCIMRAISNERVEVRPREVNLILDRLPPPYLYPAEDIKLSAYVKELLEDAPPRKNPFPVPPRGKPADESQRINMDAYSDASMEDVRSRNTVSLSLKAPTKTTRTAEDRSPKKVKTPSSKKNTDDKLDSSQKNTTSVRTPSEGKGRPKKAANKKASRREAPNSEERQSKIKSAGQKIKKLFTKKKKTQ